MQQLQPTIREFDLPREPFLRLIEANRMDQRISEYETWADLEHYCVHSADPVGRLVLGLLRRAGRRRARRRLRRRLHRPPARQLPPGRAARSRARPRLPARRGPPPLRRDGARRAERAADPAARASRRSAPAGCSPAGELLRERIGGRIGRAVGLFARGGLAALDALEDAGWDIFTAAPPARSPSAPWLARGDGDWRLGERRDERRRDAPTPRSSG